MSSHLIYLQLYIKLSLFVCISGRDCLDIFEISFTSQLTWSRSTSFLLFKFLRTLLRAFEASTICNSSNSSPSVSFMPNVLWPIILSLESCTILKIKIRYLQGCLKICRLCSESYNPSLGVSIGTCRTILAIRETNHPV